MTTDERNPRLGDRLDQTQAQGGKPDRSGRFDQQFGRVQQLPPSPRDDLFRHLDDGVDQRHAVFFVESLNEYLPVDGPCDRGWNCAASANATGISAEGF